MSKEERLIDEITASNEYLYKEILDDKHLKEDYKDHVAQGMAKAEHIYYHALRAYGCIKQLSEGFDTSNCWFATVMINGEIHDNISFAIESAADKDDVTIPCEKNLFDQCCKDEIEDAENTVLFYDIVEM